jgi:hypothetical protein
MTDWKALRDQVYQTAVNHGWHETKREFPEIACLIHSELSEALEELRKPNNPDYYTGEKGKPEGFWVEMADCVIRILDWMGDEKQEPKLLNMHDVKAMAESDRVATIAVSHISVSRALETYLKGDISGAAFWLNVTITMVESQFEAEGKNMEQVILEKDRFNQSRPFKHGKVM